MEFHEFFVTYKNKFKNYLLTNSRMKSELKTASMYRVEYYPDKLFCLSFYRKTTYQVDGSGEH